MKRFLLAFGRSTSMRRILGFFVVLAVIFVWPNAARAADTPAVARGKCEAALGASWVQCVDHPNPPVGGYYTMCQANGTVCQASWPYTGVVNPCTSDPESTACSNYCAANPTAEGCDAPPTYCEAHPSDLACSDPSICHNNPTSTACQAICSTDPSKCTPPDNPDPCNVSDPPNTCELNCLAHPNDDRCVPTPFCVEHPTDPQCAPGTLPYCALHPEDSACKPAPPWCHEHPTDPSCVSPPPYCSLPAHAGEAVCEAPIPYCAQAEHIHEAICETDSKPPWCHDHPDDPSCKSPSDQAPWCHDHPDDPSCKSPSDQAPWCHDNPDDPACKNDANSAPWCHDHPDDPACANHDSGDAAFCHDHPDDPQCLANLPIDCAEHPTDSRCGNQPHGTCATNPDQPGCFDVCTVHPDRPECQTAGHASGGGDCTSPPTCTGDEVACAQLIQTWADRCSAGDLAGNGDDFTTPAFQSDALTPDYDFLHATMNDYAARINDLPLMHALSGFFTVNISGSCPQLAIPSTPIWADLNPNLLCDGTLQQILDWVRYVVLAVASFAAVKIAIY